MHAGHVIEIGRDLLITTMLLAAPAVAVSLLIGFVISLFQTVTSIQEQTLTFAPRIFAVGGILLLTLPWSLQVSMSFAQRMIARLLETTQ